MTLKIYKTENNQYYTKENTYEDIYDYPGVMVPGSSRASSSGLL